MNDVKKLTALTLLALFTVGCAVETANETEIAIRHSAKNDLAVQAQADRHCGSFGKRAVRVQRSSSDSSFFFNSVTTTFRCTEPQ